MMPMTIVFLVAYPGKTGVGIKRQNSVGIRRQTSVGIKRQNHVSGDREGWHQLK